MVRDVCSKCKICQKSKKHNKEYGLLPEKEAEANRWEVLCIDCIDPYSVTQNKREKLLLWCCTMIDPATGWLEIVEIDTKSADNIINVVDQAWFSRHSWPTKVISDRCGEFMKEFKQTL